MQVDEVEPFSSIPVCSPLHHRHRHGKYSSWSWPLWPQIAAALKFYRMPKLRGVVLLQAEHSLELHLPYIAYVMRYILLQLLDLLNLQGHVTKMGIASSTLLTCRGRRFTLVPIMVGAVGLDG